jgi:mannosyltransferase
MVTAFVVHHGADHPSLQVAPQVVLTNYYMLPYLAERWLGFSEVAYRLPSLILMGIALVMLSKLASRLIHPHAAWFVVFCAVTLRGINYPAADARPYALAIALALLASWFLVRWLDAGSWMSAALFIISGALLWRAHLIAWPFYLIFALYAGTRVVERDTPVSLPRITLVMTVLAAALAPVLLSAVDLFRNASAHVVVDKPNPGALVNALKFGLVGGCGIAAWGLGGWLLDRRFRARPENIPSHSTLMLVIGWWMLHALALFAFSWMTGNSVFLGRYLSVALPGAALAATLAVSLFLPTNLWWSASIAVGLIALLITGSSGATLSEHQTSRWREASEAVRRLSLDASTPVLYPSPFIEATGGPWPPDGQLPGFLFCHLEVYPVGGKPYLLPFKQSLEAEQYASQLATSTLAHASRFVIYGGDANAHRWQEFLSGSPALSGWRSKRLGPFADVDAVVFSAPGTVWNGTVK